MEESPVNATQALPRLLMVALSLLALAACHSRMPRPGKPTAPDAVLWWTD